eukprot:GDKK01066756.1.p1 GENE.GDKK01066756.1~~GDKK01066756.1.p1  ORF type:complete len:105 (-),score=0.10 GDKK01066756.1:1-315(-)
MVNSTLSIDGVGVCVWCVWLLLSVLPVPYTQRVACVSLFPQLVMAWVCVFVVFHPILFPGLWLCLFVCVFQFKTYMCVCLKKKINKQRERKKNKSNWEILMGDR